jgi:hypothetical protein
VISICFKDKLAFWFGLDGNNEGEGNPGSERENRKETTFDHGVPKTDEELWAVEGKEAAGKCDD